MTELNHGALVGEADAKRYHRLLAHLDAEHPDCPGEWEGWTIQPLSGGANNRLYRATSAGAELPVTAQLVRAPLTRQARRTFSAQGLISEAGGCAIVELRNRGNRDDDNVRAHPEPVSHAPGPRRGGCDQP